MAVITPPTIVAAPVAPDRSDRTTFSTRATASFDHLKNHAIPEIQAVAENVALNATEAATSATTAETQAGIATLAVNSAMSAGLSSAATNAATATTKASEAAASAALAESVASSISGGPVASVNGMTGIVTGVATLTGTQTLTNKTLTGITETVYDLAGMVITEANGSIQTKTLSANTTFTETLTDGQSVILGITSGSYTVTWPSVTWAKVGGSGVAPTLTSTGVNWVVLWKVSSVLRGSFLGTA